MIFDTTVLIGRFQPFHRGHAALLRRALELGNRTVVVLGSAGSAPTVRNPFSAAQRRAFIRAAFPQDGDRLLFHFQRDVWDAKAWSEEVRAGVESLAPGRVAVVGFHKDSTSDYLDLFPGWACVDPGRLDVLDATPLRELILSDALPSEILGRLEGDVPASVLGFLGGWLRGRVRRELVLDVRAIREWAPAAGGMPVSTVDSVVVGKGKVLLYARSGRPGRRLLALPGGVLETGEDSGSAALRWIRNRTGIEVSGDPLRELVFDHPARSQRGRVSTRAFLWSVQGASALPTCRAGAGACRVLWVPLDRIRSLEERFFEDHFHILSMMANTHPASDPESVDRLRSDA